MNKQDALYRGTAFNGQFRVFAVESTNTIQSARDILDLSPIATLLVGKMISAAALMSLELKSPGSEISLRVDGDGELKGASVTCTQSGNLRCMAFEPHLFYPDIQENYLPGKHLGKGTLSVYRYTRGKSPSIGHVKLLNGEIAEDLANYYLLSEQVPTAVNLGILISRDAQIKAGGGILIQQLPDADPAIADILIRNITQTPNISDLMDMGLSITDILTKYYCKGGDLDILPVGAIKYKCNCSKAKFAKALLLLGKKELSEMQDGIDPVCHYCNRSYHFSSGDMQGLISTLEETK